MANSVQYIYQVLDRFSAPLRRFKQQTDRAARSVQNMQVRAQKTSDALGNVGGAVGGAAILLGMKSLVAQSSRVEDALADITRVSDISQAQLMAFEETIEQLSEELGKNKVGLLQQAFEGLKLSIPQDELADFVRLTARTAVAFDLVDQQAGRALGSIRTKMGLTTDQTSILMDQVNFLADQTAASGDKMIEIIERTSGTMKTLEFPTEVIAGLAAFANQIEVTEELAASGLNQIFARMQKHPALVKELMADPVEALTMVFKRFEEMAPEKRFAAIEKDFGLEAARFMSKATTSIELFQSTMDTAASSDALNSMLREMDNRAARSSTQFARLEESFTNMIEAIGDAIKPVAVVLALIGDTIVDRVKNFAKANPVFVRFVGILVTLAAVSALVAGALGLIGVALAAVSWPLAGLVAAGVLLTTAIAAVVHYSKPLTKALDGLSLDFAGLGENIHELLVAFGLAGEDSIGLADVFEFIGLVITNAVITPVRLAIKLLSTMIGIVRDIFTLNLSSIPDRIGDLFSGVGDVLGTALQDNYEYFVGGETTGNAEQNAVDRLSREREVKNTQVEGYVLVEGASGAKVLQSNFALDGGYNLARNR